MKEINLNVRVTVQLTETGASIYNESILDIPSVYRPRKLQTGDEFHTELWDLMRVFGAKLYLSMGEIPFVNNLIRLIE